MKIKDKFEILELTINAYKKQITKHGFSSKGVFWQNNQTQNARFDALLKGIVKSDINGNISITDYGCGYGEFYNYIKNKSFMSSSLFIGYDIVDTFILEAKKNFPEVNWICSDEISLETDYIFISGALNMAFNYSIDEWEYFLQKQLEICFKYTDKVLAFNLLYSPKRKIENGLYYTEIQKIFDFCDKNLGNTIISKTKGAKKDITVFVAK